MTIHSKAARLPMLLMAFALLALMVGCGHSGGSAPAGSPPLNAVQRHPTMTGIAAGAATHHMLKVSAEHKKENGQPLNFAEKHPTLTGIAAGVATHHLIKKMTPHN